MAAMAVEVDEISNLVVVDRITTKEEEVEVEAQTSTIHQLYLTANNRFTAYALITLETGHAALVILAGCSHQSRLSSQVLQIKMDQHLLRTDVLINTETDIKIIT